MIGDLTYTKRSNEPMPIQLRGISDVLGRMKEIHELIARRAYQIYEYRGHVGGHDMEDWLEAESEVRAIVFVGFMELNGDLSVDIGITASELPGLQVRIEPLRLIVSGKKKAPDGGLSQSHADERPRPVDIFEMIDFPVQVEPSEAKATFSNGLFQIRIPKAVKRETSLAAKAA